MKMLWTWLGVLAPAVAWACPMCADRADPNRVATYALLASMIAVPYAVGVVVVRIVRRLDDQPGSQS